MKAVSSETTVTMIGETIPGPTLWLQTCLRIDLSHGDHTLCLSIAGFQDGKSAAEIMTRSACSDQSRSDCDSQNFRLAFTVQPFSLPSSLTRRRRSRSRVCCARSRDRGAVSPACATE